MIHIFLVLVLLSQQDGYREYPAYIVSCYDGDTVTAHIDLGLGVTMRSQKFRLLDIDAPEMRGDEKLKGTVSRDALRKKIDKRMVVIRIFDKRQKGKYGRWLCFIYFKKEDINQWMIKQGYAKEYE